MKTININELLGTKSEYKGNQHTGVVQYRILNIVHWKSLSYFRIYHTQFICITLRSKYLVDFVKLYRSSQMAEITAFYKRSYLYKNYHLIVIQTC